MANEAPLVRKGLAPKQAVKRLDVQNAVAQVGLGVRAAMAGARFGEAIVGRLAPALSAAEQKVMVGSVSTRFRTATREV